MSKLQCRQKRWQNAYLTGWFAEKILESMSLLSGPDLAALSDQPLSLIDNDFSHDLL